MSRRFVATCVLGFLALAASAPASAYAAPAWNLDVHHNQTNFPRSGTEQFWFDVHNIGDTATSGPITLTVQLPPGLTRQSVADSGFDPIVPNLAWNCPGLAGNTTITCTTSDSVPRNTLTRRLIVNARVSASATGALVTNATISGGGATEPVSASETTQISATPAGFGIVPGTFRADFFEADGITPVRQAGAHPDLATFAFDFNSLSAPRAAQPQQKAPAESVRSLRLDLPPGFLGDPTAVTECRPAELVVFACPPSSQVGRADLTTYPGTDEPFRHFSVGVFNMEHPIGTIADLAFSVLNQPIHVKASLDPSNNYSVKTTVSNINESAPVFHQRVTIWGYPKDPRHDSERCSSFSNGNGGDTSADCASDGPAKPFLSVPANCASSAQMRLSRYDSWQNPGVFGPDITYDLPGQFTGCELPQAEFEPDVVITPTNTRADSPTGLNVEASIPFNDDPNGVSTPPVKKLEVELPEGMSLNPSFADGLDGCTEDQIGITHAGVPNDNPVTCPDASRIGSVDLSTPLLPDAPNPATDPRCSDGGAPLQGSIYLAAQGQGNPTEELFAIYTVVRDCDDRGVLVKLPGSMILDSDTGQITTVFENLPQFPFDSLSVKFRSGDRAPLVNPPTCGTHEIEGDLNTWSMPDEDVPIGSSFDVTQDPDGTPCSTPTLESRPFNPVMTAGTTDPVAGTHSPFVLKLTREDGEQEMTGLRADLPPGLVGKLAGVAQCSDATLASIATAAGTGQAEKDNPACPAGSKVGRTNAGSGSGPQPFYIPGSVYLAGPYDPAGPDPRAPLSLAIVAPAVAGGIDLGNVVIRTALYVDTDDAQLHAVSDPFPTILHGVPIHLRDVRVVMDRDNFTLNPTNCSNFQVTGEVNGASELLNDPSDDITAPVTDPFQVSGCGALGFSPKLTASILNGKQGTHRSDHPNLLFNLHGTPGDANLARVEVLLPSAFQIDQANLGNICSEANLAANRCAGKNTIGTATATTPLLDTPLSGPVYAVSGSGGLPRLAVILRGPPSQPIELIVRGDTTTEGARIKNTFATVPDAPVTDFDLNISGGDAGYLVNNQNICTKKAKKKAKKNRQGIKIYADASFTGQNGDTLRQRVKIGGGCTTKKKGKKSKKK